MATSLYKRQSIYGNRNKEKDRFAQTIANQEQRIRAAGYEPPNPGVLISLLQGLSNALDAPGRAVGRGLESVAPDTFAGLGEGGMNFLNRKGMEDGLLKTILATGIDIAKNPLSFVGPGIVGKGAQGAAKLGVKASIPFLTKTAQIAIPGTEGLAAGALAAKGAASKALSPITNQFTKFFSRAGVTKAGSDVQRQAVAGMQDDILSAHRGALGEASYLQTKYRPKFEEASKALKGEMPVTRPSGQTQNLPKTQFASLLADNPAAYRDQLRALPVPERRNIAALTREYNQFGDELAKLEKAAGIDYRTRRDYVYHLYENPPSEVERILTKWKGTQSWSSPKTKGTINRPFAAMAPKAGFKQSRALPTFDEAVAMGLKPVLDPERIIMARSLASANARVKLGLLNNLRTAAQASAKAVPAGANKYDLLPIVKLDEVKMKIGVSPKSGRPRSAKILETPPEGWVPAHLLMPRMYGYAVHPDVARTIRTLDQVLTDNVQLRDMLSSMARVSGMWRSIVTTTPGHLLRNEIGNTMNMALADVPFLQQPYWRAKAFRVSVNTPARMADDEIITLGKNQFRVGDIRQAFQREHLHGFGQFAEASGQTNMLTGFGPASGGVEKAARFTEKLTAPAHAIGQTSETWAKMSLFMERLGRGKSFKEAADDVRKYLFDYTDLTPNERWLKTFFPFYTWARKEFPLLVEAVFQNPSVYITLGALRNNAMQAANLEDPDIPDWLNNAMAIPFRDKSGNVHMVDIGLPTSLLGQISLPTTPGSTWEAFKETIAQGPLAMLGPEYKIPLEVAANRQMFSGVPIQSREFQTVDMGGLEVPAGLAYLLKQIPTPYANITNTEAIRGISNAIGLESPEGRNPELAEKPDMSTIQALMRIAGYGSANMVINPERQRQIQQMLRARELTDYVSHLRKDLGEEVQDIRTIRKNRQPRNVLEAMLGNR